MGVTQNIQALLKQGLLPFLLQKAGVNNPLGGVGGQAQPPGAPQGPNPNPQMTQARVPGQQQPQQQPGPGPQAGARPSPGAGVGTMPMPQAQPIADVKGLQSLLVGWYNRKQQGEHAEAANAAMNLMQAIEGAKQTGDWGPATDILHQNEKLFNKVYKGWLQKAEKAQTPEKQDPAIQGAEAGVSQYLQQKQAQAQQPPQGAPRTMGGYYLPQAGPVEFTQNVQQGAEASAAAADPSRTLQSPLTGEERRQAALGAAGLVSTPKSEAEMEKYKAQVATANTNYAKAQTELQKANAEFKIKQLDIQAKQRTAVTAEEKAKLTLDVERNRVLVAQANAEAAKARLALIQHKAQSPKQPSLAVKTRLDALDKLNEDLTALESNPPTWHFGAPPQELQELKADLRAAGLGAQSAVIPSQAPVFSKTDVKGMLAAIRQGYKTYNDSFKQGVKENWPDYKRTTTGDVIAGAGAASEEETDETTDEDSDITVSPEEVAGGKP